MLEKLRYKHLLIQHVYYPISEQYVNIHLKENCSKAVVLQTITLRPKCHFLIAHDPTNFERSSSTAIS